MHSVDAIATTTTPKILRDWTLSHHICLCFSATHQSVTYEVMSVQLGRMHLWCNEKCNKKFLLSVDWISYKMLRAFSVVKIEHERNDTAIHMAYWFSGTVAVVSAKLCRRWDGNNKGNDCNMPIHRKMSMHFHNNNNNNNKYRLFLDGTHRKK